MHLSPRRLLPLLLSAALVAAAPASADAAPTAHAPAALTQLHDGSLLASHFGGFRSSRSPFSRSRYGYGRPYRGFGYRRGHPFLRGLFWGWLLSHLFRGGFPLFPLFLVAFVWLMLRRRRRRFYGPWPRM